HHQPEGRAVLTSLFAYLRGRAWSRTPYGRGPPRGGPPRRSTHVAYEGLHHACPIEPRPDAFRVRGPLTPETWRPDERQDRITEGRCVAPRNYPPEVVSFDQVGRLIARVQEDARARRQAGFEVVRLTQDANIALAQVIRPFPVGHGQVAEEDAAAECAELGREVPSGTSHARRFCPGPAVEGKVEFHPRLLRVCGVHRPHKRERIEPVPEPAKPEQDEVLRVDSFDDPFQHRSGLDWCLVWNAEADDIDQTTELLVGVGALLGKPAVRREHAQPVEALAFIAANEEIPSPQALADDLRSDRILL